MKTFDLYHHPMRGYEAVKQGFSWPGFFFTWLWAFIKGLPIQGVILFVVIFGLQVLSYTEHGPGPIPGLTALATLGVCIVIGIKGNEWRRNSLAKRGFQLIDTVQAETPDAALTRAVQMDSTRGVYSGAPVAKPKATLVEPKKVA